MASKENIPDSARLIPAENSKNTLLTIKDDMAIEQDSKKYTVSSEVKNSVTCKVLMLDGTDVEISISKNATGQVLFLKACEHLNLLEKEYFACSFKEGTDTKVWLQNDKPISKQMKKIKWEFSFEVKFYPLDPCILIEEITRYQIYLQIRVDILAGKLPCSFVSNSLLGSYACQSQLGDWEYAEHGQDYDYVKSIKFCPGQSEELLEKIGELHKTNRGMSAAEAEYVYLDNAKNMSLYGVHQINAKDKDNNAVIIGINASGLAIYKDRIRLNRYIWPKIMKIGYKRNRFFIFLRGTPQDKTEQVVTYKLLNYKAAKRTWKLAVEHHAFFRLRDPVQTPRGVFMRSGPKYFSGVTQFQAGKAAEMIKRESQNFSRVYYTMGRGDIGPNKPEPGYNTLTVDRMEETISVDHSTRTLERNPMKKATQSISSTGDVFMTSPKGGPAQDDLRGTYGYRDGHHVTMNVTPSEPSGITYSKTPYPTGPGYMTPGGGPDLTSPLYTGTPGGIHNTSYGSDDYRRTGSSEEQPYRNEDAFGTSQDDHLKQQGLAYGAGGDGNWGPYSTSTTTKTLTRTYTASDGTLVTETRTEKNGVIETHIEKRKTTVDMEDDYDKMLADAIRSVTDMNPDLSVEKIEITKSD